MIKSIAVANYPRYSGCPWRNPENLLWLKSLTYSGIVIVGYNTYRELPTLIGSSLVSMDQKHPQDIINKYGHNLWIAGGNDTYAQWAPYIQHRYTKQNEVNGETRVYDAKGILLTCD
jgi:dihydrofolate reductase